MREISKILNKHETNQHSVIQSGFSNPNDGSDLPAQISYFYQVVGEWRGFLGNFYLNIYSFDQMCDTTSDLVDNLYSSSHIVIGDNGASELIIMNQKGEIYIGDEIGLPDSMLYVASSFLESIKNPHVFFEAFE